jgi:multiple sugar transport system permease protein
MRSLRRHVGKVVYPLIALAATLVILFPAIYLVLTSLKPPYDVITIPPQILPSTLTLDNFKAFFGSGGLTTYIWNSLFVATCTAVLSTTIAVMAAYSLTHFEYRGKQLLSYLMLLTYMFPPILLAIPLFLVFAQLHLTDSYFGLILADTAFALPFCLWLLRDFFASNPRELEHAARIDGASALRTVVAVTLPLSLPGVAASLLFAFVLSWSDYLFAVLIVSRQSLFTLPLVISTLVGTFTTNWGMIIAAAAFMAIPPLVAALLLFKYLLKGFGVAADSG